MIYSINFIVIKDIFYKLFGDKNIIEPIIKKKSIDNSSFEIIHTEEKIKGEDSAFTAAKRGKKTVFTTTSYRSSKTG